MPGGGLEFACEKPKEHTEDLEHVMKALQNLESTDEKLFALSKKYAELSEENRTCQNNLKQTQRTLSVLAREKDQLQNDHSKAVLAKSKLEGLCRELQRHNRLVKEESAQRAKEDDERRKEVAAKFQTTINEIQQQMNDHYQKNSALREENIELTEKLKGLIAQYELREQHVEKIIKHKEIEGQLFEAKLGQLALQLTEEKERNLQEKQRLLQDALENHKQVTVLVENEKQLKMQVKMYQEKYDEFQQTLTKSNDVFQNFKNEMDKMTKKIKKLEKETAMYRQRWEGSNKALLSMAEEKTLSERQVATLQNKVSKLESLCRALQEERKMNSGSKTTVSVDCCPPNAACCPPHGQEPGAELPSTSGDDQPSVPPLESSGSSVVSAGNSSSAVLKSGVGEAAAVAEMTSSSSSSSSSQQPIQTTDDSDIDILASDGAVLDVDDGRVEESAADVLSADKQLVSTEIDASSEQAVPTVE